MPLDHALGFGLADGGPAAIEMLRQCRRADGRGPSGSRSCDCGFGHVSNDASGARPELVNQSRCERGPSTCHGRRLPESSTPHVLGILAVAIAQALLLPIWVGGFAGLVGFGTLFFGRVAREEQMMLETFGDGYRAYMARTGRVFPLIL